MSSYFETFNLICGILLKQGKRATQSATKFPGGHVFEGAEGTLSPIACCLPKHVIKRLDPHHPMGEKTLRELRHAGHSSEVVREFLYAYEQDVDKWPVLFAQIAITIGMVMDANNVKVIRENIVAFERVRREEKEKEAKREAKRAKSATDTLSRNNQKGLLEPKQS